MGITVLTPHGERVHNDGVRAVNDGGHLTIMGSGNTEVAGYAPGEHLSWRNTSVPASGTPRTEVAEPAQLTRDRQTVTEARAAFDSRQP